MNTKTEKSLKDFKENALSCGELFNGNSINYYGDIFGRKAESAAESEAGSDEEPDYDSFDNMPDDEALVEWRVRNRCGCYCEDCGGRGKVTEYQSHPADTSS